MDSSKAKRNTANVRDRIWSHGKRKRRPSIDYYVVGWLSVRIFYEVRIFRRLPPGDTLVSQYIIDLWLTELMCCGCCTRTKSSASGSLEFRLKSFVTHGVFGLAGI